MKLSLIILFQIWINSKSPINGYQWNMFEIENIDLCNNNTCGNRIHTICYPSNYTPSKRCGVFEPLKIRTRHLHMGINGLRNKVARNMKYPASNMNYLVRKAFKF